jgi:hypothetical protein
METALSKHARGRLADCRKDAHDLSALIPQRAVL